MGLLVMSGCGPAPGYEPPPQVPPPYAEPLPPGYSGSATGTGEGAVASVSSGAAAPVYASDEIAIGADTDEYSDTDPSALSDFRPALEGHGEWVDDGTYGTVWVPAENEVGTDFTPYVSAGHWTYDDSTSWVWVSDYSWGWAPFHYGRWVHVGRRGWAWIPGRVYSGAWVVWRTGAPGYDYVGWAPAAPDWYWYGGVAVAWSFGWSPYYYYCNHHYLYGPGLHHHVYHGPSARDYEAHTRPYAPSSGSSGPGRVAANPSVGSGGAGSGGDGRVAANPSVGSGGRVAANPRVGAGVARGPTPDELGIKRDLVVAPPRGNRDLERAQAFATPRTAAPLGGSTPSAVRPNALTASRPSDNRGFGPGRVDRDMVATPNQFDLHANGASNPAMSSRLDAVARAPQYQQPGPGPRPSSSSVLPEYRANAVARTATPGLADSAHDSYPSAVQRPNVAPQAPAFRAPPNASAFHSSTPSASPPTMRSPSVAPPVARSSPPVSSQPTFRSSPSVSPPAMRSTPSVSAPRPSSNSRPSAPSAPVRSGGGVRRR